MDRSRLPKRDKNEKTIWERLMSGAVDAGERARGRGVAPKKTRASRPKARGSREVQAEKNPNKAGGYNQSKETRKNLLDKASE